jgi:endoglucanase
MILLRLCHEFYPHPSRPGTDAAAGASAAFAACSNLYANRSLGSPFFTPASLQNSTYAQTLLTHAQDLYAFAVNASGGMQTYQTVIPQVGLAYPSSGYGDDLAMAALLLAWATNSGEYYSQAESYYDQYSLGGKDAPFNWDSKTPGLAVLFAQLANAGASFASNLSGWQAESERYFDRILNGRSSSSFKTDGVTYLFSSAPTDG